MWAITAYYNPCGYARRIENYKTFRARLAVPLVTVEASFDGQFVLGPNDADILIQRRATDVMWQKERLLNVALKSLPSECQVVAWLDCDVVFDDGGWPKRAADALADYLLVQLFSERVNVGPSSVPAARAVADKIVCGDLTPADLYTAGASLTTGSTTGLGWAARRDLLDEHGLYDACILGSGCRAILAAALGELDYGVQALSMTQEQAEHYRDWGSAFFGSVGRRVTRLEGRAVHLWHGDLLDRAYASRHEVLMGCEFDPATDLTVDREECWAWSSDKPELHDHVRRYFWSRKEDARGSLAAPQVTPAGPRA